MPQVSGQRKTSQDPTVIFITIFSGPPFFFLVKLTSFVSVFDMDRTPFLVILLEMWVTGPPISPKSIIKSIKIGPAGAPNHYFAPNHCFGTLFTSICAGEMGGCDVGECSSGGNVRGDDILVVVCVFCTFCVKK